MAADSVTIGRVEVISLTDGILEFDLCSLYPSVSPEEWSPYQEQLAPDHRITLNMASYLIRSDERTVLVDTGLGPDPAPGRENARGELLDSLAAKEVTADEVDIVVMTHLHGDHVGWNLTCQGGEYLPTFPKARYLVGKADWEYFTSPENLERFPVTAKCVVPLQEMGLLELMEGERVLTAELTSLPTPGHTPGHTSVVISSKGERGLILGDAAHHPVQVREPGWSPEADTDPVLSSATRRSLMERLEREGAVIAAGHFPAPGFGRVVRLQGRHQWQCI